MDATKKSSQIITIRSAEKTEIDEVDSIVSFDDEGVLIKTELGKICVEGESLQVIDLNKEKKTIEITGNIKGVFYIDKINKKKRGLW